MSKAQRENINVKFGVNIGERIFAQMYPDAIHTAYNCTGYDFIWNYKLVDIKASSQHKSGGWNFQINKNQIAHYFCLMAFDNPVEHNLEKMYMVPAAQINDKVSISITDGTKYKYKKYEVDIK